MTIGVIVFLIILILIFGLLGRFKNNNEENNINLENDNDLNILQTIEEQFFDEVKNGKEKIKFLKIHNQFDLMFIKSLLQSENIPYYVEFENISKTRPGMYIGDLGNYNLLYILDEDYGDAIEIVKNYIKTKSDINTNIDEAKDNARNFGEILLGNWKVSSANDTDGIEIIEKRNIDNI